MIYRSVFWVWSLVGIILLACFSIPPWLQFSNGLFLLLYCFSVWELMVHVQEKKSLIYTSVFILLLTFCIEWIGVHTGFPFGEYNYTNILGFTIFQVPYTISFAWLGLIYNSLLLSRQKNKYKRALETGIWIVVIDIILDPVALARGFWVWDVAGGFYGVPFQNFLSWGLIAAVLSLFTPLLTIPSSTYYWACRLYQSMLLFFGILALVDSLPSLFFFSLLAIYLVEWRQRHDRKQKE